MNGCKGNKIRHIVRLRQIVRKWRKLACARKAALALGCKISARWSRCSYISDDECGRSNSGSIPPDVPAGHLAVYVGKQCTRFVIRATYLNHPVFRALLDMAEEEFGYNHQGGLSIPCDELMFEHILRLLGRNDPSARHLNLDELQRNFCNEWHCSSEAITNFGKDCTPLLHAFVEKSVG
eukprot:Gb_02928 [translate_table: standard]